MKIILPVRKLFYLLMQNWKILEMSMVKTIKDFGLIYNSSIVGKEIK